MTRKPSTQKGKPRNRAAQTAHLKKAFLESFRLVGNVKTACDLSGAPRRDVYTWKEKDEEFLAAFNTAEQESIDVLEAAAWKRAVDGVESRHPIVAGGDIITEYVETKYSDTLLIFLLKARDPRKYAQRTELSGPGGDPLQTGPLVLVFGGEDDETTT